MNHDSYNIHLYHINDDIILVDGNMEESNGTGQ